MLNEKFSYANMELWSPEAWKEKYCQAFPLLFWIEKKNYERNRLAVEPGKYEGRTDAVNDPHSYSEYYTEITGKWEEKGLFYHAYRMGDLCWMVMIPKAVLEKRVKAPKTLIVQCSVDYRDKRYAMNMLEHFEVYNQMAAEEEMILLYTAANVPDKDNLLSAALLELGSIFYVDLDNLYLDVTTVYQTGNQLKEIEGFRYKDDSGMPADPDSQVEYWNGIPVLRIANRWQSKVSNLYGTASVTRSGGSAFDLNRHVHSICGKKMAEAMALEHRYEDASDPELLQYWESIGTRYEQHETAGQRWISLVPACAYGQTKEKLPALLVFRETSQNNPYLPLVGFGGYYGYCDIVAQGDLIMLMFAMETPDDKEVAGVATQGNRNGLYGPGYSGPPRMVSDEAIEFMATFDIPVINFCGTAENDYTQLDPESRAYANMIDAFQRRLKSARCPVKTEEEIRAARTSSDYATRKIGVPVDRSEVVYMFGSECYCGYLKNFEGKEYLKLVVVDNLPHITIPQMSELSWSFLRRFARNLETGELVELY